MCLQLSDRGRLRDVQNCGPQKIKAIEIVDGFVFNALGHSGASGLNLYSLLVAVVELSRICPMPTPSCKGASSMAKFPDLLLADQSYAAT